MLPFLLGCAAPSVDTGGAAASGVVFLDEQGTPDFRLARWQDSETAETVFEVPYGGYLFELDIHSDSGRIAMAYTRPPWRDEVGYDRSGIYEVHSDGSIERLACEDAAGVWCFYPQWSADGTRVWYVRYDERDADPVPVLAWSEPGAGASADVQTWATEPAVSPDGAVAWVGIDPDTGTRSLELGDADGAWQRTLVAAGAVSDLGQPIFSPDGSAVWTVVLEDDEEEEIDTPSLSLVSDARAHDSHDEPGDWWAAPVDGGALTRLTWLSLVHYDGAADPQTGALLSVTDLGLVQVQPDTGETDWLWTARTLRAVAVAGKMMAARRR